MSTINNVRDWKLDYAENLDLDRLREIFSPPNRFRVSESKYPVGTEFSGAMRAGICFGFLGSVTFDFGEDRIQIDSGKYAYLPEGSYRLKVEGESDSRIVMVWEIPTRF